MCRKACEESLFSSEKGECDFIGDATVVHYDAVLKVQIGKFPPGTKFDGLLIDPDHSLIALQNFNEDGTFKDEHKFVLEYVIGESLA